MPFWIKSIKGAREQFRWNGMTDEEIDVSLAEGNKNTRDLNDAAQWRNELEAIKKYLDYRAIRI